MRRGFIARISAGAAMALMVLGVPVALSYAGWPLPRHWPNWSVVSTDIHTGYLPGAFATHLALTAAWMAWAFIAYEIVAESASFARHAVSRRSRALGPLQPVLAKLVATVVLSLPTTPVLRSGGAPSPPAVILSATSLATETEPLQPASAPPAAESGGLERGGPLPTYVVARGDTLWGIAQRHLGDPTRWTEIAALNRDRPEGSASFGNPNWIYPGWTLTLPADATGLPAERAHAPTQPTASIPAPASPPGATLPGSSSSPAAPSKAPSAPTASGQTPPTHAPGTPPDPRLRPAKVVSTALSPHRATAHGEGGVEDVIGMGLLGLGLAGVLVRMRRAQQRHRRLGRRIALPTGAGAATEAAIGHPDPEAPVWIGGGLRLLGAAIRTTGTHAVRLAGVRLTPERLEVLLDGPIEDGGATPPAPFEAGDSGFGLARRAENREAIEGAGTEMMPAPALVSLGRDDEGLVLANLEAAGLVCIAGDASAAAGLAMAMAIELVNAAWAEGLDLHVVGLHPIPGLGHLGVVDDFSEVVPGLEAHVRSADALLDEAGVASFGVARMTQPDPVWAAMVVIFARAPTPGEKTLLLGLAEGSMAGAVVVVPADLGEVGWRLVIDSDGGLDAPGLGARLATQGISPRQLTGIADLLGVAARLDDVPASEVVDDPPSGVDRPQPGGEDDRAGEDGSGWAVALSDLDLGAEVDPGEELGSLRTPEAGAAVEIALLGAVELRGIVRQPERPQTFELLAWLAVHPGGGDTDRLVTALWPDGRPRPETVTKRVWDARVVLGLDDGGELNLPKHQGALALGPGVRTDWAAFTESAASEDPEDWRAAMALVRGEPLAGTDYRWATGILANMVSAIVDLGARLGEWALENGDVGLANWAAEQTLLACPYDERPYRILMRAAHAAGNRLGVKAVMDRLARVVEDDVEPYDFVHPETVELYRRLAGPASRRYPPDNGTQANDGTQANNGGSPCPERRAESA